MDSKRGGFDRKPDPHPFRPDPIADVIRDRLDGPTMDTDARTVSTDEEPAEADDDHS
ncbi:F-box domain protein [Microbacterium phage MO526]|uniref:F-box domain protein n=1 Tax=Microbacterium phage MO526 TaxID=3108092 RepID=A0ABZ0ZX35_9CAUD|nr:F-box domain protein [Microbacterium phage MO526]